MKKYLLWVSPLLLSFFRICSISDKNESQIVDIFRRSFTLKTVEPQLDTSVPKGPFIAIAFATMAGISFGIGITYYAFGQFTLHPLALANGLCGAIFGAFYGPVFKIPRNKPGLILFPIAILFLTSSIPILAETLLASGASFLASALIMTGYHWAKDLRDA
jgi:hypothetical protein